MKVERVEIKGDKGWRICKLIRACASPAKERISSSGMKSAMGIAPPREPLVALAPTERTFVRAMAQCAFGRATCRDGAERGRRAA